MPAGEAKRGYWIRGNALDWQSDETALRCGDPLPKNGLAWFQVHLAAKLGRDGHLATFRDGCFHMTKLSCYRLGANRFDVGVPICTQKRIDIS
jgi:hypothetical protein